MSSPEIVILSATRTPLGSFQGALYSVRRGLLKHYARLTPADVFGEEIGMAEPWPSALMSEEAADGSTLPDPLCTPGATNPDVTQDTLYSTVCKKGYAASIRPPRDVTEAEKRSSAASYDYQGSLADTEYDHLIPLGLGGDPNDPRNLWVEPIASPNPKDDVEFRLIQLVCRRQVALSDAQAAIAGDWTTALAVLGQS